MNVIDDPNLWKPRYSVQWVPKTVIGSVNYRVAFAQTDYIRNAIRQIQVRVSVLQWVSMNGELTVIC